MCWGGEQQQEQIQPQISYTPYYPPMEEYSPPVSEAPVTYYNEPSYTPYNTLSAVSDGASNILNYGDNSQIGRSTTGPGFSSAQESTSNMIPGAQDLLRMQRSPIYTWA